MNVRLFKPSLGEEELLMVKGAFERSWIGLGEKVSEFESAWSAFIGCDTSVGVNSATAALHLALQAFRFKPGKKVMVPAITFASTALAPVYNDLEPVFVDVDEDTASLSLADMEKKFDNDVVAVMPVHFAGHPARMTEIMEFARAKKLKVIEDCAHTAGGEYEGRKLGTWGDIGCFSFEEKKCLTTGDGGMMCSNDVDLMKYIKPARWLGINKEEPLEYLKETSPESADAYHWHYEISLLGFKYNMNDLAASIGLAQLKKLPEMNKRRSAIIRNYLDVLQGTENIKPLLPYAPEQFVYHLFGVRCRDRERLILHLKSMGISTGVHYYPLYRHPFFQKWKTDCPVTEKIWKNFVTLPLHADLTNEEMHYTINALLEADKMLS